MYARLHRNSQVYLEPVWQVIYRHSVYKILSVKMEPVCEMVTPLERGLMVEIENDSVFTTKWKHAL